MKNYFFGSLAVLALLFSLQSCNEEVQLTNNFEETAVVYGLIDQADSVHYIKITRAFIGPGNSLNFAQIPDSNYFDQVDAVVYEIKVTPNSPSSPGNPGDTLRTWSLNDTIVDNKETDGVFYAPDQKLYVFHTTGAAPLRDDSRYDLSININNGEFQVTGSTQIVDGITTDKSDITDRFAFAKNSIVTGEYNNPLMQVSCGNSSVVNAQLEVVYQEFIGSTDSTTHTFSWELGERAVSSTSEFFSATGQSFYELLANDCAQGNPAATRRKLEGIRIKVVGGAEDLYQYMLVNQPSSTLAQNKPTFTNLTATNGHPVIGLFSSRQTHTHFMPMHSSFSQSVRCIDRNSTMELCVGPITGQYLFCSDQPLDMATESFACN